MRVLTWASFYRISTSLAGRHALFRRVKRRSRCIQARPIFVTVCVLADQDMKMLQVKLRTRSSESTIFRTSPALFYMQSTYVIKNGTKARCCVEVMSRSDVAKCCREVLSRSDERAIVACLFLRLGFDRP